MITLFENNLGLWTATDNNIIVTASTRKAAFKAIITIWKKG